MLRIASIKFTTIKCEQYNLITIYVSQRFKALSIFSHALTLIAQCSYWNIDKAEARISRDNFFNLHKTSIVFMLYYCSTFTVLRFALYNN